MTTADLIRDAILLSMMLLVISLGLRTGAGDAGYLFRRPPLLIRSVLAMNIIMPVVAIWLVTVFDLRPSVKVALVALSVSPVPPFLPDKQLKLTQSQGYVYGLLVSSAVLAIVLVPATGAILQHLVARRGGADSMEHTVTLGRILQIVGLTVLLPLGIGILARHRWPERAVRLAAPLSKAGSVLLVLALVPVLLSQWPAIRSLIGDGTLLAIIVFTALGLGIGHSLGGTDPQNRTVLALATAARHPAVALAVASAVFPDQKLAPAAVLLALLVGTLASIPYSSWRGKLLRRATPSKASTAI